MLIITETQFEWDPLVCASHESFMFHFKFLSYNGNPIWGPLVCLTWILQMFHFKFLGHSDSTTQFAIPWCASHECMNPLHISFQFLSSWSLPNPTSGLLVCLVRILHMFQWTTFYHFLEIARSNYLLHWLTSKRTRLALISDQVMRVVYTFSDRHDRCWNPSIGMGRSIVLHVITVRCYCSLPIFVKTKVTSDW